MADSSSHSDPQSSHLPVEIVEKIIRDACTTHLDHPPTLSSIALTSHVLRLHANNTRFSALFFVQGSYVPMDRMMKSARRLVDVLKSGKSVSSGMPGILHFSKSLSIEIMGSHDDVMGGLADASWVYIFKSLFREPNPGTPSPESALRMAVYRDRTTIPFNDVCRRDGVQHYVGIDWRSVSPAFVDAFIDLVKHSGLNTLLLELMRNVPKSIFEGSGIKLLDLREVTVDAEPATSVDNLNRPAATSPLKWLCLGSASFSDIALNLHSNAPPGGLLPSLVKLTMRPRTFTDLSELEMALANAPSFEMLNLELFALFSIDLRRSYIPYRVLPRLSHLKMSTSGDNHGLSLAISFLNAPGGVGSLRRLDLTLMVADLGLISEAAVRRNVTGMGLENLATHLSLPALACIETINVHLHVYNCPTDRAALQAYLATYVADKLQSLKERLVLKVDVV